jgi:hypothetical protein
MNKFIRFNFIFFSCAVFLLNPILGMDNDAPKKEKEKLIQSKSDASGSDSESESSSCNSKNKKSHKKEKELLTSTTSSTTCSSTDYYTVNDLPDEILLSIFEHVLETGTLKDFANIPKVDRRFYLIWKDYTLQEVFLNKFLRSNNFYKEIHLFKKTQNHKFLECIRQKLEATDFSSVPLLNLLKNKNIKCSDIIPNICYTHFLTKFALYIKFNDITGIREIKKFITKRKLDERLANFLSTPADLNGQTLLHCVLNHIRDYDKLCYGLCRLFVQNGADISCTTNNGNTILHYAAKTNNLRLLEMLITESTIKNPNINIGQIVQIKNIRNQKAVDLTTEPSIKKYLNALENNNAEILHSTSINADMIKIGF